MKKSDDYNKYDLDIYNYLLNYETDETGNISIKHEDKYLIN